MKVTTHTIGSRRIDFFFNASSGRFSAEIDDQEFSADTMAALVEQLRKVVKRMDQQGTVEVTVLGLVPGSKDNQWSSDGPFQAGDGAVDAKLRSRHEREYNTYLLVSADGALGSGKKFKITGSGRSGVIARRLTLKERMRYNELVEAKRIATTAFEDFVGSVKIDPDAALLAARKKGGE